jgi:hypothetical protein
MSFTPDEEKALLDTLFDISETNHKLLREIREMKENISSIQAKYVRRM